jgi:hypothetical protein
VVAGRKRTTEARMLLVAWIVVSLAHSVAIKTLESSDPSGLSQLKRKHKRFSKLSRAREQAVFAC